jgi:aerobic C4-dicarboxylate transport protein
MVIAPVIFLTVVTGIAGMRDLGKFGRVVLKAFVYFFTFSTLALILGMIVANVVHPGAGMNIDPATLHSDKVADYAAKAHETVDRRLPDATSSPTPWSAPSPTATSCRCCSSRSCSASSLAMVGEPAKPVVDFLESCRPRLLQAWSHI